jgi:hypothetical protein
MDLYINDKKDTTHMIKLVSSKQLIESFNIDFPYFQREINEDKLDELKSFIESNPTSLTYYFPIIIGYISGTGYIIDGQHRIMALKMLLEADKIIDKVLVQILHCSTYDELKKHFININKNTPLDKFYSNIDKNFSDILLLFKKHIKTNYKQFLSTSDNPRSPQINIDKMIKDLSECEEIILSSGETTADILIHNFDIANNRVYEYLKTIFETYGTDLDTSFMYAYIRLLEKSNDKGTLKPMTLGFPVNWIELLINPYADIKIMNKYKKVKMTKPFRIKVWEHWMGKVYEAPCPVCSNLITINTFEAGHIVSEKSGGSTTVENCRPICGGCNKSMGSKSFYEFVKKIDEI